VAQDNKCVNSIAASTWLRAAKGLWWTWGLSGGPGNPTYKVWTRGRTLPGTRYPTSFLIWQKVWGPKTGVRVEPNCYQHGSSKDRAVFGCPPHSCLPSHIIMVYLMYIISLLRHSIPAEVSILIQQPACNLQFKLFVNIHRAKTELVNTLRRSASIPALEYVKASFTTLAGCDIRRYICPRIASSVGTSSTQPPESDNSPRNHIKGDYVPVGAVCGR